MGKYIQGPTHGKADMLIEKYGAKEIGLTDVQAALNAGDGVVCVVDNGPFEAAAYIYSQSEFVAFSQPTDFRLKTWLRMGKVVIEELLEGQMR